MSQPGHYRLLFISTCPEAWGGSEELWAQTALEFLSQGHTVRACKTYVAPQHPMIQRLRAQGCGLVDLDATPALVHRLLNRLRPHHRQITLQQHAQQVVQRELQALRPHLVVVSQGSNFDGVVLAEVCRQAQVPYVLICQKAVEFFFPPPSQRAIAQRVFQAAQHVYFVSEHNRALTALQLGLPLPQAEVVRNPFKVAYDAALPFPPPEPVRLACVARLNLLDKGQDMLLQVLAQPRWQQRPLHVSFFGQGDDQAAIQELAAHLGLRNITLAGQVADIEAVWATHQALVLPSRSEGLPLALVEAMLSGRPAIITPAGGSAEAVRDNETGFVAAAPTIAALDEALERAWQARANWAIMGQAAAGQIRTLVPADPARIFTLQLQRVLSGESSSISNPKYVGTPAG